VTFNLPAAADSDIAASTPDSLWRGAAMNLVARVLAVLFGLAILVVVARQGPAVQGAFSLFVAIESALLALGSGLGLLLAREAAQAQQPLALSRLRNVLATAVAAGVLASLVLLAASGVSARDPYRSLWLLALAAPFLLLAPTAIGLWMGQGRLIALNTVQVASPALALGALALAPAIGATGLLGALGAWAIARAVVGFGAAGWALTGAATATGATTPPQTGGRDAVRFVAMVAVANIVSLANYRATLFVVERMEGLASAGVYSVAVQVAELLWLLSWAVTVTAYSSIGTRDATSAAAATLRAVRLGLGATLVVAPLLAVAAWLVLPALLGQEYRASLTPLFFLLPGVAAYSAASGLSAYYTQHRGLPHWAAGIAGLSLVLTMALAAWTVPRWGVSGAAVATSLSYLVAIGVAFGIFLRDTGLSWAALWRNDRARMAGAT
jgi:O-antigen/teichoic acid export membrane protein